MTRPMFNELAEQAVLAAMFMARPAAEQAVMTMEPAMFHGERHRLIFSAMTRLIEAGSSIDPLTVANVLTERGHLDWAGGKDYLGFLVDAVPHAENVQHHAGIVTEWAARRALLATLTNAATTLAEGGTESQDVARAVADALLPFTIDDLDAPGFIRIKDAVWPAMERLEAQAGGMIVGLRTGYAKIDAETGGFQKGELVIVGGAEKIGKSIAALNLGLRVAARAPDDGGGAVAYVSAEMTTQAKVKRALGILGKIDQRRLRTGTLVDSDWPKAARAAAELGALPFWIDDEAEPSLADVTARCTALKAAHPEIALIIVDFLQLVHVREKGMTKAEELGRVAYGLKRLAKKLGVVVIAPCQVNTKDIEDGKDPRPRPKDLQGSSGMRQAADFVVLLYRPAFYDAIGANPYEIEFNFAVAREASPFLARLRWDPSTLCIDDFPAPPPIAGTTSLTFPDRRSA